MTESESGSEKQQLEVFREHFRNSLRELLDNAEIILDVPRPPDPASMGFDERTLEELGDAEKRLVRDILFEQLGIDPQKEEAARQRTYQTQTEVEITRQSGSVIPSHSPIDVFVYRTNRNDQGIVLQELIFPDKERRWVIGPDQNI